MRGGWGTACVVVSTWLALLAWRPLLGGAPLVELGLGGAVLAVAGWGTRRLTSRLLWPVAAQAVLALAWAFAPQLGRAQSPLPLAREGVATLIRSQAPVPPTPGVMFLAVLVVSLLVIVADALAVGLRSPAWAVVPLLVFFAVRAVGLRMVPVDASTLGTTAMAVVIMLLAGRASAGTAAGASSGTASTPAGVTSASVAARIALATLLATGGALGVSAMASATVAFPPARQDAGPLQMNDPSLDLKRNLNQQALQTVLTYSTTAPGGTYLKLTTLSRFDANGFSLANARVRLPDLPGGPLTLPQAPGTARPGTPVRVDVTIENFVSEWLPAPYAPSRVEAGGGWGYLWPSLSVLAVEGNRTRATVGLSYAVTSSVTSPSAEELAAAQAGQPEDAESTLLPSDVPPVIPALSAEVTGSARTAGERALAILAFLRSGEFEYSLDPAPGTGYQTLEDFLTRSKEGYCEQFAGAMAALARAAGIPSRVVVGFTPGTSTGEHQWTVTNHDMHTWPELYFTDYGWVAFEPTPGLGTAAPSPVSPTPTATPEPTPTVSSLPTPEPTVEPSAAPSPDETAGTLDAGWLLGTGLAALVLVAAGLTPRLLRSRLRSRRLGPHLDADGAALDAWAELAATAVDSGLDWPAGSPRYVGQALSPALSEAAAADLHRLAQAAERALFGPPTVAVPVDWRAGVVRVTDELTARTEPRARRRGRWLPRSLWMRR